jgi:4-oxalocrotonate tautomerase
MPIVIVHLMEGRDEEKKDRAIQAITRAVVESLEVKPESVRVLLQEVPRHSWGIAGKPARLDR